MSHKQKTLFISGLTVDSHYQSLKAYFSQFGPIANIILKKDTQQPYLKSFAYLVFKDLSSVEECLSKEHWIYGKKIETERIYTGNEKRKKIEEKRSKKICVKG